MHVHDATPADSTSTPRRWARPVVASTVAAYEARVPALTTQRQFALETGVARTTLQHWLARKDALDADPAIIAFFESPAGLAVLHRIVGAAHMAFTQVGPCGSRLVSMFLELSHLDRFVASSLGTQQGVSTAMQEAIVLFGRQPREDLAKAMSPKTITVCQDETFHPETCLVAIEPVSDFILLERYCERRDAASWTEAMAEAVKDLPIQIVQATGDEARGLLAHAREGLGAHHSPDLFHVQHELTKGICPALAAHARAAEAVRARAETQAQARRAERDRCDDPARPRDPGRRLDCEQRLTEADERHRVATEALAAAEARQAEARKAIEGFGEAYHPWDPTTGAKRSAPDVSRTLEAHVDEIARLVTQAGLSQRASAHVEKARRMLAAMRATIAFVHLTVLSRIRAFALEVEVERAVLTLLIPGLYLRRVAAKAPTPERRAATRAIADQLLARARAPDSPLMALDPTRRDQVERVALACADLFQRSSSCVEGRNGQLALRHHSLHRLGARKLEALTVVHNFFIRRSDTTTAAERFFGAQPADMFAWVLDHLDVPARPARARSKARRVAA